MRVVVIGAGILGLATAWYLRRAGAEVVVLERRSGPGLETSFGNGALQHPSYVEPWNAPGVGREVLRSIGRSNAALMLRLSALPSLAAWGLRFLRNATPARFERNSMKNIRLALYSAVQMRSLREEAGIEYGHSARGALYTFRDSAALGAGAERAARLAPLGLVHRRLNVAELLDLEPALVDRAGALVGALHFPGDEAGDCHRFCVELAGRCAAAGVDLRYDMAVSELRTNASRVVAAIAGGESVAGDAFVVAAAAYSGALLAPLGIPLPIRPVKGYSITVARAASTEAPRVPVIDTDLHAAIVPVGDAAIRVAGTAEFAGFDVSLRAERIANLRELLRAVYPRLAATVSPGAESPWAGLRPITEDGVPLLGATPLDNLFVNTGHGQIGWTTGVGSGRAVADRILGFAPAIDLNEYALARFDTRGTLPQASMAGHA
jgi:D-amino-acid dehydrogenase